MQRAISAQQAFGHTGELVIPTPEVFKAPDDFYNALYPTDFKLPRQLIHVAPFDFEQEVPGYDLDSEDETWLGQQKDLSDLTPLKFEEMMDKLEKSSGQQVVLIDEAKLLLKERDDLITAVYDYWVDKRLRTQQSLIPLVKTEKRDGTTNNSPYVAFRRRTEKMQTRKNRKNDEVSYEKMLKLRRDISRAVYVYYCIFFFFVVLFDISIKSNLFKFLFPQQRFIITSKTPGEVEKRASSTNFRYFQEKVNNHWSTFYRYIFI